jgi:hypothetical protein
MGRLGRFSSRRWKCVNKDAAANVEAKGENQEAERCEDGSPSAYLNLDQDAEAEVIGCFLDSKLSKLYISADLNIVHIFKFSYWLMAGSSSGSL